MKKIYGRIYGLCHPITGELRYVGQTILELSRRLKQHCKISKRKNCRIFPVARWKRKLARVGLRPVICELGVAYSKKQLNEMEVKEIADRRATGERLLNVAPGGEGGDTGPRSLASRRRMSKKMMGHKHSPAALRKMSLHAAARRPEVKAKISAARKGTHLSKETKAHLSEVLSGRRKTALTRRRMCVAWRRRKNSAGYLEYINALSSAVRASWEDSEIRSCRERGLAKGRATIARHISERTEVA
jgi:hypothetical protein